MKITLMDESMEENKQVMIQIICDPQIAEWITALISPLLYETNLEHVPQAMPEALIQLASSIDQIRDWEFEGFFE